METPNKTLLPNAPQISCEVVYQILCGNGKSEAIKNTNKDKIEILPDLFSQGGSSLSYKCNLLIIFNTAHIKQMRVDRAASKNRLAP